MDKKQLLLSKIKNPSKFTLGLVAVLFLCLIYNLYVWVNTEHTDNAYVDANITMLTSQVSGAVKEILIHDNEIVKAGEVIAKIDDTNYRASFEQAKSKLESAKYSSKITDEQRSIEKINFAKLQKDKDSSSLKYELADKDYKRNLTLKQNNFVSQKSLDDSKIQLENAKDDLLRTNSAFETSKHNLALLDNQYQSNLAAIRAAEQEVVIAKKNLDNTVILSPINGTVASSGIRLGNNVFPGMPLLYIVPYEMYIVANFKETQIVHFYEGQEVEIKFDSIDGKYRGKIRNIAPASGATFSLIPVDNATGNFTKIVQRVPVNIDFDYKDKNLEGLAVGMSTKVSIYTRN
ncbi:MAG: hypothetical protein RLZZ59_223 [Pseudomonadota bacterium]|jgi:membrane fusion protein (multidrug efflux system)